jgi:hypothetical protein
MKSLRNRGEQLLNTRDVADTVDDRQAVWRKLKDAGPLVASGAVA